MACFQVSGQQDRTLHVQNEKTLSRDVVLNEILKEKCDQKPACLFERVKCSDGKEVRRLIRRPKDCISTNEVTLKQGLLYGIITAAVKSKSDNSALEEMAVTLEKAKNALAELQQDTGSNGLQVKARTLVLRNCTFGAVTYAGSSIRVRNAAVLMSLSNENVEISVPFTAAKADCFELKCAALSFGPNELSSGGLLMQRDANSTTRVSEKGLQICSPTHTTHVCASFIELTCGINKARLSPGKLLLQDVILMSNKVVATNAVLESPSVYAMDCVSAGNRDEGVMFLANGNVHGTGEISLLSGADGEFKNLALMQIPTDWAISKKNMAADFKSLPK